MPMIDWLQLVVDVDHEPINGGMVISTTPDGDIEWETTKRLPVEGSHSSQILIRTSDQAFGVGQRLWISGNPVKWFQGHNLFGTDDVHGLSVALVQELFKRFEGRFRMNDMQQVMLRNGLYELKRVDCTTGFALDSRDEVRSWIRAASTSARGRHQKVSAYSDQTIYLGQKSRRLALKVYCKGDEIKAHPLPKTLPADEASVLHTYADNLLRVELTLRAMELKRRGLERGRAWRYDTPTVLLGERIKALQLPENIPLKTADLVEGLPARLVAVYKLWLQGEDLRAIFPKRTFYRYRTELLKHDIDLSTPPRKAEVSNVVPLWRYLVAEPVGVPEWAKGTPLYFDPSQYLKTDAR